jgi:hypothetical protein
LFNLSKNFKLPSYREIERKKVNSSSQGNESENDKKSFSKNLKGSVSTSSLPSFKSNSNSFEANFKRSFPWQSVYIPDTVDKSIEEVISSHSFFFFNYIFYVCFQVFIKNCT